PARTCGDREIPLHQKGTAMPNGCHQGVSGRGRLQCGQRTSSIPASVRLTPFLRAKAVSTHTNSIAPNTTKVPAKFRMAEILYSWPSGASKSLRSNSFPGRPAHIGVHPCESVANFSAPEFTRRGGCLCASVVNPRLLVKINS